MLFCLCARLSGDEMEIIMKKFLSLLLVIVISVLCLFGCESFHMPEERPEDFSFYISWGENGFSAYPSSAGRLIKTPDAQNPADYLTVYRMNKEELDKVYRLIRELNVGDCPEEFGDGEVTHCEPSISLTLTVTVGESKKTVKASRISGYDAGITDKAKAFIGTVKEIVDIIESSEEWKSLPDVETK